MDNKTNLEKKKNPFKFLKRAEMVSVLSVLCFLALAVLIIFVNPQLYQRGIHEGDIALKDFYAPYDFTYTWGKDEEKTIEARSEAMRRVPHYLKTDTAAEEKATGAIGNFFTIMNEENAREATLLEKAADLQARSGFEISEKNYKALTEYSGRDKLPSGVLDAVKKAFAMGIIATDIPDGHGKGAPRREVIMYDVATGSGTKKDYGSLLTMASAPAAIEEYAQESFGDNKKVKQLAASIAAFYIRPNLIVDIERTEMARDEAVGAVRPVYRAWAVKKNEIIIEKGKRVNERNIVQLSQLRSVFREGRSRMFFFGAILLFVILGMIGAIYMVLVDHTNILKKSKETAIILTGILLIIVVADFIMRMPQPSYFIPMAGMGMLFVLLIGFNAAFISVVLTSILISALTGGKIEVALVLMTGSIVGMYAVRKARHRSNILFAGLLAGVAKFLAIVCAGLINGIAASNYLKDGMWGIASGILSGVVVMGFLLPVFEYTFKVPTNISLLELSDLNQPLLRKLAIEAPGTYHHSIMVGNLAEAACDGISANSLLARVGAYYHDIGKLTKPHYYGENEMGEKSKHSGLTPSMSSLIIMKHVKEGLELADKYKLNNTIKDFIRQHHGDGLITYFYQKAVEQAKDTSAMDEENFRYPGPKPQTKEAAIVLLADCVEAASRALLEPAPSSIRNMVTKNINAKFIDGQLDDCDLTLKDVHRIADSFVRVLMAIFHTRASYPEKPAAISALKPNGNNKLRKPKH